MISRSSSFLPLLLLGATNAYAVQLVARSILPPVTPLFCSKSFCFYANGPYAVRSTASYQANKREGGAVVFGDGTVISFGAALIERDCNGFSKKWGEKENGVSLTYLCIPQQQGRNMLVAIKIQSKLALTVERYQGESEICVWGFSANKVMKDGAEFLPIRNEVCVGDRMGHALPDDGMQ